MTSKKRRVLRVGAAAYVTMSAICRTWHMILNGSRPIDWITLGVEVLVLAAIFWFEWPEWAHKRKANNLAAEIMPLLEHGRKLKASLTYNLAHTPNQELLDWRDGVISWTQKTEAFLMGRSRKAALAFTHIVNAQEADRTVRTSDGSQFAVAGIFGDTYQRLQIHLNNLQKIIEAPENYL